MRENLSLLGHALSRRERTCGRCSRISSLTCSALNVTWLCCVLLHKLTAADKGTLRASAGEPNYANAPELDKKAVCLRLEKTSSPMRFSWLHNESCTSNTGFVSIQY